MRCSVDAILLAHSPQYRQSSEKEPSHGQCRRALAACDGGDLTVDQRPNHCRKFPADREESEELPDFVAGRKVSNKSTACGLV